MEKLFYIDPLSRIPVYEQLIRQVEQLVLRGQLKPQEQLPSVRALAGSLVINPNTIQKAYAELDRRGIVSSVPGRGCFISSNAVELLSVGRHDDIKEAIAAYKESGVKKSELLACIKEVYG